ncbi:methylenetetrahydrofolate reductase [Nocardioides daeguensis]|uniref:Methylenetetrahydrofolate reductase n=1 Tax=Nocardioides daeguensis TaxID=908359 RepID=A0ABP6VNS5_9ACTN|nr:methylenetetrahydrofolate reductase [Nocardioides daeguensis]MBV6727539.1 methylenetetrahydrofolate reductase [Nocardioides daeguensis]MCR1773239.1 methylenetetrahydrofolate reductase [Nocardioides daeguensis]
MDVATCIEEGRGGFVLFAITPPRQSTPAERLPQIARATLERLEHLDLDGLVLYDIDDESARNPAERPFPFSPTVDPSAYRAEYLSSWPTPVIVYRAVGKYQREELRTWLAAQDARRTLTVMVGASSSSTSTPVTLLDAQALRAEENPQLLLGGVAIPERHSRREDEHLRLIAKQEAGCRFFVTQVVYDLNAAKNLVSDYRYACQERGLTPVPIVFTFSVCGSMRTLEFLRWLGVDVPRWIENDLRHSTNPLGASFEQAAATAAELAEFCHRLDVPFGLNVESVSIRREEIEASVDLAARLGGLVRPG